MTPPEVTAADSALKVQPVRGRPCPPRSWGCSRPRAGLPAEVAGWCTCHRDFCQWAGRPSPRRLPHLRRSCPLRRHSAPLAAPGPWSGLPATEVAVPALQRSEVRRLRLGGFIRRFRIARSPSAVGGKAGRSRWRRCFPRGWRTPRSRGRCP